MFTTGFSMKVEGLWDEPEGDTLQWMRRMADRAKAAVTGSVIIKEGGAYYNRLYFVIPGGEYYTYNKRHLFTLAGEEKVFTRGTEKLLVNYKGWRIMPLICYDLRFPVWCRNTEEVDLQIYVANWPERRAMAWKCLLRARSIENMGYVAGLNRVGADGNDVSHSGDSAVYDELGNEILGLTPSKQDIQSVTLNKEKMLHSREKFSFLRDRDKFDIRLD